MKPGQGKNKGSAFERDVCRLLTQWITGSLRPEIFWRSASSGAQHTQMRKHGKESRMPGDIMANGSEGSWLTDAYVIECKYYKTFSWDAIFKNQGEILEWWKQVCRDAEESGKKPMLIFKKNNYPIYMAVDGNDDIIGSLWSPMFLVTGVADVCRPAISFKTIRFEQFLDWADPETLKFNLGG